MLRRFAPWLVLFEVLRAGRAHWDRLDPEDRRKVTELMRRTKADPRRVTAADRAELRELAGRLQLRRLLLSMGGAAVMGRRRHGRRR
jgi:hypothetical protein